MWPFKSKPPEPRLPRVIVSLRIRQSPTWEWHAIEEEAEVLERTKTMVKVRFNRRYFYGPSMPEWFPITDVNWITRDEKWPDDAETV